MQRIGCHVSIAGGVFNAPGRAKELGCEVFQIFSRSPRGGSAPALTPEVVERFKQEMKSNDQKVFYIHTPYYINFASDKAAMRKASVRIVREELERGSLLGAKYIMTHLGSAGDGPRPEAMNLVAQGVKEILKDYRGSTELLLEISAGSGAVIGCTFEELAHIIDQAGLNIGVCIDSCHMFASGYDIKTQAGMAKTLKIISATVGKSAIKLIHTNDSKVELGAKRDLHEHIGKGKIGREGFERLMDNFDLDFILETEHDKVKEDIAILKKIRSNK